MLLLYTANTGNGRRALIMLEECGLPYQLHKVEIGAASPKPPELLAINPEGTIPTLVDLHAAAGKPLNLRQSAAIILYLAEKSGAFLPPSPPERTIALEWLMFAMTDIVGANTAMYQVMTEFPQGTPQVSDFFRQQMIRFLEVCDRRLSGSDYLCGREYTVADIALYPVFVSRRTIIDESPGLASLKRWGSRISARPAVQRALAVFA
jgi:GST-like protein